VRKSAAAVLLQSRVGEKFDAVVAGASEKGTWCAFSARRWREKSSTGEKALDVGERTRVKLVHVDPDKGHIDFVR
jgi:exoribonuclease II